MFTRQRFRLTSVNLNSFILTQQKTDTSNLSTKKKKLHSNNAWNKYETGGCNTMSFVTGKRLFSALLKKNYCIVQRNRLASCNLCVPLFCQRLNVTIELSNSPKIYTSDFTMKYWYTSRLTSFVMWSINAGLHFLQNKLFVI